MKKIDKRKKERHTSIVITPIFLKKELLLFGRNVLTVGKRLIIILLLLLLLLLFKGL